MVRLSRRVLLASAAASFGSGGIAAPPPPPPAAVPPPPPAALMITPSAKISLYGVLPERALPFLCAQWFPPPHEDVFFGAVADEHGRSQICTIRMNSTGGEPTLVPLAGLGPLENVRAMAIDQNGRCWVVCGAPEQARLLAAERSGGWPSHSIDLAGVVTPQSQLEDLVVDVWFNRRAVIADAGGEGALIVAPIAEEPQAPSVDRAPPWRVEQGVGRSLHFTDRPMQPDGPARICLFDNQLAWGFEHSPAVSRLPTAILAASDAAPIAWRWLEQSYGAEGRRGTQTRGAWGYLQTFYLVDGAAGAVLRGDMSSNLSTLLVDSRLKGAVRLTARDGALFVLTEKSPDRPASIWKIA